MLVTVAPAGALEIVTWLETHALGLPSGMLTLPKFDPLTLAACSRGTKTNTKANPAMVSEIGVLFILLLYVRHRAILPVEGQLRATLMIASKDTALEMLARSPQATPPKLVRLYRIPFEFHSARIKASREKQANYWANWRIKRNAKALDLITMGGTAGG